ncbi:MAG: PAS domain-containing protein [Candidatus Riflebacteria bacterium]|nr:PAS domain-containing protein [Candidatus Riflebacteria bacterium]
MNKENMSEISLSLFRDISKAISNLTPDRALLYLTESAITATDSVGAMLLSPHEKNNIMVPFVKSFLPTKEEPIIGDDFLQECFNAFLRIYEDIQVVKEYQHITYDQYPNYYASIWPVNLSGKPQALLVMVKRNNQQYYNDEQCLFLESITPIMGSLFENFRLNNEMIHKNSRLSALYEISQQAESVIDFRNIYDALGKVARSFIKFDTYVLYFLSNDGKQLEARNEANVSKSFPKTINIGEGPVGLAAKEMKPYLTYTQEFNSVLILPFEVSGRLTGVLTIGSQKPYAYRDEDIIGLQIIATQIASIDTMFKNLIKLKGFTERILESMNSGVLIFDPEGKITYSNQEVKIMLTHQFPEGWDISKNSDNLPQTLIDVIREVIETKVTHEDTKIRVKAGGQIRILSINTFPIRNETGRDVDGIACFIKDVTRITALEEQLMRADKLSAIGVLAAGIAHEIRNPLTGMKMIVQLLESDFKEDDNRREPLEIIQREIDRLEKIIGSLLDFARPSKPKVVDVAPIDIVNDCYMLIKNQLNKQQITFEIKQAENCPLTTADPDQLKQVFINIMVNAIQAIGRNGKLTVYIEPVDGRVKIAFEDTGCGIPHEKLRDIFNPFMTTKEDGTGLGLPMAQRTVEEHGGTLEVQSVLGEGSTFTIYLPEKKES